jgi:Flp pilus assembly protein TadD
VPDCVHLHYGLGIILNKQGRKVEATEEFRTVLQIDPNFIKARKALETILKKRVG